MGLGGYLTWTALARELVNTYDPQKVFPFERHGDLVKLVKTPIFANNPYILQNFTSDFAIPMQLNSPETNYCKQDTPFKATHRHDKHIIQQLCEAYGIDNPKLKCEMYFIGEEIKAVNRLLSDFSLDNFLVIEPQSNNEYTVNKKYPLKKWQYVADSLMKQGYQLAQIGKATHDQVLDGVVDLTGKTNFREAALIIQKSKLFISSEGGLMHAANAVETPSVILYTGFIHPRMTSYPENTNIWIGKDHDPCGMKVECPHCKQDAILHDPAEILTAVENKLK